MNNTKIALISGFDRGQKRRHSGWIVTKHHHCTDKELIRF